MKMEQPGRKQVIVCKENASKLVGILARLRTYKTISIGWVAYKQ